jgi:hypothetical protein
LKLCILFIFLFYIVFAVKYSLFGESTMEEILVCEEVP